MTWPLASLRARDPAEPRRLAPVERVDVPPRRTARTLALAYDSRRNNFGFFRFLFATIVIWSHSYTLAGQNDPIWAISGQIDGGSIAVDGFFVLSGFLITQSWLQQPLLRAFAVKRFLRLMPALLVATVFGAFVIGPLGTTSTLAEYLSSRGPWLHFLGVPLARYLFIPGIFATNPHPDLLNSPLWSLRYEMLCYLLVALLGLTVGRRLGAFAIATLAAAWLTYAFLPASISPLSIASQTPRLLASFFAGVMLYLFRAYVPVTRGWALVAAIAFTVTLIAGGVRLTLPVAGAYLLLYFACLPGLRLQTFDRYGDFSYGLYIFACPIQQLLMYRLGSQVSASSLFILAFLPTLALAALSWHFLEAPSLALKKTVAPAARRS